MNKFGALLCIGMALSLLPVGGGTSESRRNFLDMVLLNQKGYYKLCDAEHSFMEVVFIDLNDDGLEEMLYADGENHYTDGSPWSLASRDLTGTGVRWSDDATGVSSLYGRLSKFYRLKLSGNVERLVILDAGIYENTDAGNGHMVEKYCQGTAMISMTTNGAMKQLPLNNGLDDLISNPGFVRLDRAMSEVYHVKAGKISHQPRGNEQLEEHPQGNINHMTSAGLSDFVVTYRKEFGKHWASQTDMQIAMLFLDADNDGDVDFYISSEAERCGNDEYRWHLVLNKKEHFEYAKTTIWYNLEKRDFVGAMEPEVTCGKNEFYRLHGRGMKPSYVVLRKDGKRLYSDSYRKHVPEKERQRRPPDKCDRRSGSFTVDEWRFEVNGKLGFTAPGDFMDIIANSSFLGMERLTCSEVPALQSATRRSSSGSPCQRPSGAFRRGGTDRRSGNVNYLSWVQSRDQ